MKRKFSVDVPLILLLTCILSVCVVMVLIMGARSYQGITEMDTKVLDSCTAQQYLTAKLRYQDGDGMRPVVTDMEGNQVASGPVLQCFEEEDGVRCMTVIYAKDGHVYELFTLEELGWSAGEGEYVLDAQSLAFEDTGKGIRVMMVAADGQVYDFYVGFASGKGGLYGQE